MASDFSPETKPETRQPDSPDEDITARLSKSGRTTHGLLVLLAVFCLGFTGWAAFSRLDIVSLAMGEVMPSSKVKEVQHLEGGIVRDILVKEGEQVAGGQPLMALEPVSSDSSVEELEVRMDSLRADLARLLAEEQGEDRPDFPPDLVQNNPKLVDEALELFRVRKSRHASEIGEVTERVEERRQQIKEIQARIANTRKSLELAREQTMLSEELLEEQLTTRYKHLAFLREETRLQSKLEEDAAALSQARSHLSQARDQLEIKKSQYAEEVRRKLNRTRQELEELKHRLRRFSDSLNRTVIRSPVEGVVKTLHIVTQGGVVQPGMTVAEIVPASDELVVEAHLPTGDIGYVWPGQKAMIKLASRDAMRFGKIRGSVTAISPDTFVSGDGRRYYRVRVETSQDHFESGGLRYKLYPGMPVMAFIHTGQRTVLGYLLDPFVGAMGDALQER